MIVEQRDYHVHTGKLPELVRLYADEGIAIQQEVLGGFVGAFTTDIGALSTYTSLWSYASHAERETRRAALQARSDWQAVPRADPAADPHPAEPHPRADAVLADRVEAVSWASSTGRWRSSRARAQGIGRAIADGLAAEGARIVVADLQGAEEAAEAYPGRCRPDRRRRRRGRGRADGRGDGRAVRRPRRARQQRGALRVARDAAVHRDPARRVAAGDGRQRRVDVPHLPRGRARDARARRWGDRQHLVRDALPRRPVPAPLRDEQGRDRRVHARAREGARPRRDPRELRRARVHDVGRREGAPGGDRAAPRRLRRGAHHPARPGARGRRRRGRLPRGRRPRRSSPARRSSSTAGSTSIEALAATASRPASRRSAATASSTTSTPRRRGSAPPRSTVRRSSGSSTTTRSTREGALVSRFVQLDPFAAWVVRCDRIDFPLGGIARLHTHPGPGIRYLLQGEIEIETEGRSTFYGPGGAWFESGPDPVRRTGVGAPRDVVRARARPARRVGGEADDPLPRSAATPPTRQADGDGPPRARDRAPAVSRSGGRILVDQLALHGADLAFGVPGESYIDVLDALRDSPVRYVTCRHEGGAATMAEAYGKLTGAPGICLVTRGPGATQASVGVHTAFQDGTPLLLLVGQIPREDAEREAFQEIDYRRMFGPLAKWVAQVDQVERIPELTARAFRVATSGRPGPGRARAAGGRPRRARRRAGRLAVRAGAGSARGRPSLEPARRAARSAPSVRSRSSAASRGARRRATLSPPGARRAASRSRRPGAARTTSTTRPPATRAISALGADPALRDRLRDADVLLVVGARLGDIETGGYATIVPPGVRPRR